MRNVLDDKSSRLKNRRGVFLGAMALTCSPLVTLAADAVQPAPQAPIVWRGLTQAQLNAAFDQLAYAPNSAQILRRYRSRSDDAATRLGPPLKFQYGETAIETANVYRTSKPNAPVHVFIHGGAWQITDARDYIFLAEMFVNAGVHFVVPDFAPVKDLDGDLTAQAKQVEKSIAWVSHNASTFGGDTTRLHFSGHSSGAHLLGVALTRNWKSQYNVNPQTLRSALLLSGIYDLEPVSLSERSSYVRLGDPKVVSDLSPVRNVKTFVCPTVVGHGSLDTPEYQRQSNAFVDELKSSGKQATLLKADFYNHFEQLDTLGNPLGIFGRVALNQIGIQP